MSFEAHTVVEMEAVSKCHLMYAQPADRLKQMLWRGRRRFYREFWALREVSFSLRRGEVLGVIGRNGAGKSTLLQLLCGTMQPTAGRVRVQGRIAALLELGAGFNPEFSGRENVYLAGAILGLSRAEMAERFESIVDFSGVRAFIDQPVKTYSSGMYVRLAFSVATSVNPDILVIDEALSVGDGDFARRSFDRIMALKESGVTILFCSHSLYYVEALCSRALWLEQGRVRMLDNAAVVIAAYQAELDGVALQELREAENVAQAAPPATVAGSGSARIVGIEVSVDGLVGRELDAMSGESEVTIRVRFASDPALPCPSLAVTVAHSGGAMVSSAGSVNDAVPLSRAADGRGAVQIRFPALALLKGDYWLGVYLFCERGLHVYDFVDRFALLKIKQRGLAQGLVVLPHVWEPLA